MSWKLFWQIVSLMVIGALLLLLINTVMLTITMQPFRKNMDFDWNKKMPPLEIPGGMPLDKRK